MQSPEVAPLRRQTCSFLQLPRELRDQIYRYTVVSAVKLSYIAIGAGVSIWPKGIDGTRLPGLLNLAVLHLNRQVRSEALLVFFKRNMVHLDLPGPLRDPIERVQRQIPSWSSDRPYDERWPAALGILQARHIFANPFRFQRIWVNLDLSAYRIREHNHDLSNYWAVKLKDFTERLRAEPRMVDELIVHVRNLGRIKRNKQLTGYGKMLEPLLRLMAVRCVQFEVNDWPCIPGQQLVTAIRQEGEKIREILEYRWLKRGG